MKLKKLPSISLENKKLIFFEIGLVIALTAVLIAFEWTTVEQEAKELQRVGNIEIEQEIIPITRMQDKPPPPPPSQVHHLAQELIIVKDETVLENELEIQTTEADEATRVEMTELSKEVGVEEEEIEEEVFSFFLLEDKPEYPGGEAALLTYIALNTKYPQLAKENEITGKVFVSFIINQNGEVTNVIIKRGVHPSLDEEAIRVVKTLPKWKPGKQRGKPVRVEYIIPITFVLQ